MDAALTNTEIEYIASARRVLILHGERIYPRGAADNYPESICLAALALHRFL